MANGKALNKAISKYLKVGIIKAVTSAATAIEIRTGVKTFARGIPILGVAVGGGLNYQVMKKTGYLAKEFYRELK